MYLPITSDILSLLRYSLNYFQSYRTCFFSHFLVTFKILSNSFCVIFHQACINPGFILLLIDLMLIINNVLSCYICSSSFNNIYKFVNTIYRCDVILTRCLFIWCFVHKQTVACCLCTCFNFMYQ
jgi:hypothetical protein